MTRVAVIVMLAACNAPPPSLRIAFAGPPTQACPSTDCADVPMNCPSVISIRIVVPPDVDPDHPLLEQCQEMMPNGHSNMCVVASIDLVETPLPVQDLEVQVALYPTTAVGVNATGTALVCPNRVQYSAVTGFPVEQAPTPALGGHAFYHPGDQTVTVTLGCTDLDAINTSCAGLELVKVAASIENFEDRFPVLNDNVQQLEVSAGEPRPLSNAFELFPRDTSPLTLQINGSGRPTWEGEVQSPFNNYACLKVWDNAAQSTATVTCRRVTADQPLELLGELMGKKLLDDLLKNLELTEFPSQGLTVGIVVDEVGDPIEGAVVTAKQSTVRYWAADSTFSGTATSDRGIFVSTDAPFGTEFSTEVMVGNTRQSVSAIGGLLVGMATIVILRPGG
jgi:hypothetical protein